MSDHFQVFYTDRVGGKDATEQHPRAMPQAVRTEDEAFRFSWLKLAEHSIVWKIERPDGTLMLRGEVEARFRALPR